VAEGSSSFDGSAIKATALAASAPVSNAAHVSDTEQVTEPKAGSLTLSAVSASLPAIPIAAAVLNLQANISAGAPTKAKFAAPGIDQTVKEISGTLAGAASQRSVPTGAFADATQPAVAAAAAPSPDIPGMSVGTFGDSLASFTSFASSSPSGSASSMPPPGQPSNAIAADGDNLKAPASERSKADDASVGHANVTALSSTLKSSLNDPQAVSATLAAGSGHESATNISLAGRPAASGTIDPGPAKSGAPAPLPPAHQMLDSAPVTDNDATSAAIGTHLPADVGTIQMHLGVQTNAFGNVEIHTVVEQSQVGVTIHGDRDVARWFSPEMGGLESGLNSQHMNLTGVDFSSNRSGVQTATGFEQGQPRQEFSQHRNSYAATAPVGETPPESVNELEFTATVPAIGPESRVSILA
jgi:hypothetical protein